MYLKISVAAYQVYTIAFLTVTLMFFLLLHIVIFSYRFQNFLTPYLQFIFSLIDVGTCTILLSVPAQIKYIQVIHRWFNYNENEGSLYAVRSRRTIKMNFQGNLKRSDWFMRRDRTASGVSSDWNLWEIGMKKNLCIIITYDLLRYYWTYTHQRGHRDACNNQCTRKV